MQYQQSPLVYSKQIDGVWYILETNKKTVRELNELAGFIWLTLSSPQTSAEILERVCHIFSVDKKIAEQDLKKFLSSYVRDGYVILIP